MDESLPNAAQTSEALSSHEILEAVEGERCRLRRALNVMVCARFALDHLDFVPDEWGLDCADVVEVACGLVRDVMVNLDSVNLRRSVETASPTTFQQASCLENRTEDDAR